MMDWSGQQEQALSAIQQWMDKGDEQVFRLFGYAGTGKTTLARTIGDMTGNAQYAAFTGKAALVMRKMGCENAKTIHSLIYKPQGQDEVHLNELQQELELAEAAGKSTETIAASIAQEKKRVFQPHFALRPYLEWRTKMFIIDECSMVSQALGQDLLSFNLPVLVLGDPAQLPPVDRNAGYFTEAKPDVMLTEIHRQARDNPIIALASHIREGGEPPTRGKLTERQMMEADQILTGKNLTRHQINRQMRQLLGHVGDLPLPGEKMMCFRNNHELGLLNGSIWTVRSFTPVMPGVCSAEFWSDDEEKEVNCLVHWLPKNPQDFRNNYHKFSAQEFDFAYAITTHKAQGSQWGKVVYVDEWHKEDLHRHRYTGVTRAVESVEVVRR